MQFRVVAIDVYRFDTKNYTYILALSNLKSQNYLLSLPGINISGTEAVHKA